MSEHDYGHDHHEHESHHHDSEHSGQDGDADREPDLASSQPAKKRGPKPMTDQPTIRFEGQLLEGQYSTASTVVTRLKMENRSTPSAERRRLTINTLVRIGMTIVLEHESALHGKNEHELLDSLRGSLRADRERAE